MEKYSRNQDGKRMLSAGITLLLLGILFSTAKNREQQVELEENLEKETSFDTELENDSSALIDYSPVNSKTNRTILNESTLDYSNYQDVIYQPFTHTVYLKVEGSLSFDSINVNEPNGYQVEYVVQMDEASKENGYVYGQVSMVYTNTEPVLVREYYDSVTGTYVYNGFGTVIEKEKQKTIE